MQIFPASPLPSFRTGRIAVSLALLGALLLGMVPAIAIAQDEVSEETMSAAEVVEQVAPAVVTVFNISQVQGGMLGETQPIERGAGTGFIIDEEGHIVTNWHVVTGGDDYAVILADGTELEAELIGEDPRNDLAVVKIDPSDVPAFVNFGDSNDLQPGQPILAIGSPLGAFTNTVTQGIVSGLGRNEFLGGPAQGGATICQNYANLIQHDAAINPGNSGGPLFNLQGDVVGVNTLGIPVDPSGLPTQGLFFAVPSDTVTIAVEQLIETGTVAAPYVGISYNQINPTTAAISGLPADQGLLVGQVETGAPAADAGILEGDIISSIEGIELTPATSLANILFEYEPGDDIEMGVLRQGEELTVNLTLGQAPPELFEQCVLVP